MSTFWEEGGEAIMRGVLGLDCPSDLSFRSETDYAYEGCARGGSANLDLLGNVANLYFPVSGADLNANVKGMLGNLEEEKTRFQRIEMLSVAYTTLHVVTRLAAYKKAKACIPELVEPLRNWLRNFWCICRMTECHVDGRPYLAFAGERSSGYEHPNWFGHHAVWRYAVDGTFMDTRAAKWAKLVKSGRTPTDDPDWDHINSWIDVAIFALQEEIRETSAEFIHCELDEAVKRSPKFTFRERAYFWRAESGNAQWWGRPGQRCSVNGNTGPIGFIKKTAVGISTLPENGGPHYRQKPSTMWTEYVPEVWSVRVVWPEIGLDDVAKLPIGSPTSFWMVDPELGWVNMLTSSGEDDVPPAQPEPTPQPAELRKYDQATDLLVNRFKPLFVTLDESNTTQEERAYLTAELEGLAGRWRVKPSKPASKPWWKL